MGKKLLSTSEIMDYARKVNSAVAQFAYHAEQKLPVNEIIETPYPESINLADERAVAALRNAIRAAERTHSERRRNYAVEDLLFDIHLMKNCADAMMKVVEKGAALELLQGAQAIGRCSTEILGKLKSNKDFLKQMSQEERDSLAKNLKERVLERVNSVDLEANIRMRERQRDPEAFRMRNKEDIVFSGVVSVVMAAMSFAAPDRIESGLYALAAAGGTVASGGLAAGRVRTNRALQRFSAEEQGRQ